MRIEADQIRAALQPLAEMARALAAATPELGARYSAAIAVVEGLAAAGAAWEPARAVNGVSHDVATVDEDLLAIVTACAAHDDIPTGDWLRWRALEARVTVTDRTSKLIGAILVAGGIQVVIDRDDAGRCRVVVPTERRGMIEARGGSPTEALDRAFNLVDTAR